MPGSVVLPQGAAVAMTLWLFHAHAHDAAEVSPLLLLSSPVRQCGKTRALELISGLVPRHLMTSNMTGAALFRVIEKFHPTLCIDEADSFMRLREDLRNLLNAGHSRKGACVVRCAERTREPQRFSTWAPKVVALIGRLHDTLESRSIIVRMRRRARHEIVESMRLDRLAFLDRPKRQIARWAQENLEALREEDPVLPADLDDRAADNWRPLMAIADRLGPKWARQARTVAVLLSLGSGGEKAIAEELLTDVRTAFLKHGRDLWTEELLAELVALEGRPWGEWRDGRPWDLAVLPVS